VNPFYQQIVVTVIAQALMMLGFIWYFRRRKREGTPDVIEAALKVLIAKQDLDFRTMVGKLEERNEKRMDRMDEMSREKEDNIWHVLEAIREQGSITRADIMWLKAKVNGSAWKPGGIASGN